MIKKLSLKSNFYIEENKINEYTIKEHTKLPNPTNSTNLQTGTQRFC